MLKWFHRLNKGNFMKSFTTLSIAAVTALFIGCGGGGGSSTPTNNNSNSSTSTSSASASNGGIFVDSAVKGLNYKCNTSATTGTTDVDGRYECQVGDTTVTFAIGTRNLGTTMIADIITPRSFFNGSGRDDEILNLAQLLQTMDKDGNPDNGIELDETAILNWQSNHTGFDDANFDTLVSQELGKTLVSENTAKEHFNDVLSAMGMSGINPTVSNEGSSSSISSAQNSSAASVTDGQSIDSANLAGYTIVSEYKSGTKVKDIKKVSYIFLPNNESITVFELFSGARKVARGTYNESNGKNVAIINPTFDNNEAFIPSFGISSPNDVDKITVGESTALYKVTSIIDNANNGIDEATVASTAVEIPEENTDAPMYDELYGKSLSIYNGISADLLDGMDYTFKYAGNARYDSNVELHCTDYGYTDVFTEGTEDGVTSKTYMFPGNSNIMCLESTYSSGATGSGSINTVWYK